MSDKWDFYFCQVEDKPASIFVNFDIAKEAPLETHTHMAYVRLHIKSPRDNGFPDKEELDTLKIIGDRLEAELTSDGSAVYVGRITSDGSRDLIFYSLHSPEWENRVEAAMLSFPAYQFKAGSREDRKWKAYLNSSTHQISSGNKSRTNTHARRWKRKGTRLRSPGKLNISHTSQAKPADRPLSKVHKNLDSRSVALLKQRTINIHMALNWCELMRQRP